MRYYSIKIIPKEGHPLEYTTLAYNNQTNGAAIRVDLDIFQTLFHQPAQLASVVLFGVDFSDLNQSANWNGAKITIAIGMSKGLPFANPFQSGEIINGTIYQSFGNWQGTYVSLNLLIIPSDINPNVDVNLAFNWIKGNTLQSAVEETLKIAYPDLPIYGAYSEKLIFTENQPAQYFTLKTFSQYVNAISKKIITDENYLGASIGVGGGKFILTDGTVPPKKTTLVNYVDLIGNLTWINVATIQAKLVMRADLNIGDYIIFPKNSPTVNTATTFNQQRNLISFDGTFLITKIHHVGSSRMPDANAWVTIVDCVIPGKNNEQ